MREMDDERKYVGEYDPRVSALGSADFCPPPPPPVKPRNPYGLELFPGLRSLWCKLFHGADYVILRQIGYGGEYLCRCRKCDLLKTVRR